MTADKTEKYRQEFQKETGNRFGYEVYVGEVEGLYVRWLESRLSSLEREREELSFAELRKANVERNGEWDSQGKLDVTFRGLEFAGEAGEVCNKLKKLERERRGLRGSRATKEELADELADSIITADLIGMMENVDLAEAVIRVFNRKSDELKLKRHLALASLTGKE